MFKKKTKELDQESSLSMKASNKSIEEVFKEIKDEPWHWYNRLFWFFRHRIWDIPRDVRRYIVSFFQRGRRGWSHQDTWEFFAYLSTVIKGGLIHLKKYQHGYPGNMTEKEWNEIQDKMIKAFSLAEAIGEGEREHYLSGFSEEDQKKFKCLTKEEDELMKEGMALFIKEFFSLWD